MKSILAIGGSQFAGRVFSIYASRRPDEFSLSVLNRGRYPLNRPQIAEYACDRNDTDRMRSLIGGQHFDAVVDFCAYEAGQVEALERAAIDCSHYILISTANVCEPLAAPPATSGIARNAPQERKLASEPSIRANAALPDPVKDYIIGKLAAEREARALPWPTTILRPAFIYGPFDYSNRMAFYFKGIKYGQEMAFPSDSTARFSASYVKDFANMLLAMVGNERVFGRTFNVAHPEPIDWNAFEAALTMLDERPQNHAYYSTAQILEQNMPIPFPVDTDESYPSNELVELLGLPLTPFETGLRETWDIFKDIV